MIDLIDPPGAAVLILFAPPVLRVRQDQAGRALLVAVKQAGPAAPGMR